MAPKKKASATTTTPAQEGKKMPLDPGEIAKAISKLILVIPRLARWKRLTAEQRANLLDELTDCVATLARDVID